MQVLARETLRGRAGALFRLGQCDYTEYAARVAKLADARDLKSRVPKGTYRFDSGPGHHLTLASAVAYCVLLGVLRGAVPSFLVLIKAKLRLRFARDASSISIASR